MAPDTEQCVQASISSGPQASPAVLRTSQNSTAQDFAQAAAAAEAAAAAAADAALQEKRRFDDKVFSTYKMKTNPILVINAFLVP